MKKILFLIFSLGMFIMDANALTTLTATVTSNDDNSSETISLNEGNVTLPLFCSKGTGCTITVDSETLKSIGKYNFGSGQEYFYIKNGEGATIYEEAGPNPATEEVYKTSFNKIVINPTNFTSGSSITISLGNGDEARDIKFIPTIEETPDITPNPTTDPTPETNPINETDTSSKDENVIMKVASLIAIILLALIIGVACTRKKYED